MKKSINGYFKFYNKEGISCRIKCPEEVDHSKKIGTILIKFKHKDDHAWLYHSPKKEFKNCLEVVNFILKNLENTGMIFKILYTYDGIQLNKS